MFWSLFPSGVVPGGPASPMCKPKGQRVNLWVEILPVSRRQKSLSQLQALACRAAHLRQLSGQAMKWYFKYWVWLLEFLWSINHCGKFERGLFGPCGIKHSHSNGVIISSGWICVAKRQQIMAWKWCSLFFLKLVVLIFPSIPCDSNSQDTSEHENLPVEQAILLLCDMTSKISNYFNICILASLEEISSGARVQLLKLISVWRLNASGCPCFSAAWDNLVSGRRVWLITELAVNRNKLLQDALELWKLLGQNFY